ncbi:hypothetical protein ACMXYR_12450 [Neptuniibacter sp. QD29_5]|uniref:hypothetical protein n=1 Tax=Neptuniibacter sp. QD29_5 TaxID=3398207 RepID=UPI0039F5BDC8
MKGLGLLDFNTDQVEQLKAKYGEDKGDIRFPLEGWKALALIDDLKMMQTLPEWKQS